MRLLIGSLVLCLSLFGVPSAADIHPPIDTSKKIAITFDDAPKGDGAFFTGEERSKRLVEALSRAGVDEALFFVRTKGLDEHGDEGEARLWRYVDAGHMLGNHSHAHMWMRRTDADVYVAGVKQAQNRLSVYENVLPLFRYPYLDEGRDPEKRTKVRTALKEMGLSNGYVTVDNYEWYMDVLAAEAKVAGKVDMDALERAYVELMIQSIEFYDGIALEALGRSPKHVLLLHENDLAALFVDELVLALKEKGWRIVPASEAYHDPIAGTEPETRFNGQGRVAAIAHTMGWEPRELVHFSEDEVFLREEFQRRGILKSGAEEHP